ncbi:MAG: hypothetical protein HKM92_04545 [Arenibacter sp.]|nr:hypothetical protein [Arenibacter sp.]
MGLIMFPVDYYAQEKEISETESSEVFLEEYTDEFQEKFFAALQQKSIGNYDRAINLFLECKQLDPENPVLDHELARSYLASKQFVMAQQYGIAAVVAKPQDYWVLNTLVEIMQGQGALVEGVKARIPFDDRVLKENLSLIYYRQQNYEEALKILNGMQRSEFARELSMKINDSLQPDKSVEPEMDNVAPAAVEDNPMDQYISIISNLLAKEDFKRAAAVSAEALESFPLQPYFYYSSGLVLSREQKYGEAISILESGLDFLLEDVDLANKIYKELADANRALGNSSKANMYLSKIKSGL